MIEELTSLKSEWEENKAELAKKQRSWLPLFA